MSFSNARRSGQACIRDTRITVGDILSYLASGMTNEEILEDFPELAAEDITAALAYSADVQNQLLVSVALPSA
ncbi:MAG: DUF433 domain-containing protein [Lewinella sp.]|nr:DUF433 domain-containing protein [Lewinella sp.]